MRGPSCMRAGALVTRRALGLSISESLRLEEHLAQCEACRRDADMLSGVRAIAQSFDPELDASARARAVQRALRTRPQPERAHVARSMWAGAFAGAALTAAVAIAIVLNREAPSTAPHASTDTGADTGAGTRVAQEPALSEAERQLIEGETLHAQQATRVQLAHARIDLGANSVVRWNAQARELTLDEGKLTADVDPSAKRSFAVVARDFRAEVLGTRFAVTPESVVVEHGVVRVVDSAGTERAKLRAGERYDHEAQTARAPKQAKQAPREAVDGKALLREARTALAADELERAKLSIERALGARLGHADRAEALTLRAELALARGDKQQARTIYLDVSQRFAELPAGENALFAAARTQPNAEAAAKLLARYLARYPHGRFVDEAKKRLAHLVRQQ